RKSGPADAGFVANLGSRVSAAVIHERSWLRRRWRSCCRRTLAGRRLRLALGSLPDRRPFGIRRTCGRRGCHASPGADQNGLLFRGFRGALPKGRVCAFFAIADYALVDDQDVRFDVAMLDSFALLATAAFENNTASSLLFLGNRRKIDVPKVGGAVIHKCHSVGINLAFGTDAADNPHQ